MKMKLEKIDWDRFNNTNLFGNFHRFNINLEAELIKTFRDIIYGDEMFNKSVWKFIFHPQQEEERERNIYIPQINNALKCCGECDYLDFFRLLFFIIFLLKGCFL